MIKKWVTSLFLFRYPIVISFCILGHLVLQHVFGHLFLANFTAWIGIAIGSFQLLQNTVRALLEKKMALDYIAILAIFVGLYGHYYLVSTVIILMLSGGYALEEFVVATAKKSLTALISRIPNDAQVWDTDHITETLAIDKIKIGQDILIRKGEIIPLDGILTSDFAETDESSITGEPYLLEKRKGDQIRSGTVNMGDPIVVRVTAIDQNSTYRTIIKMVQEAQLEKSPMIRMADRYSLAFIAITFCIALVTYITSHNITYVLSVLVIATPCPLILATPIALMGGVSAASKRLIIVKRLRSLETLSHVQALIFDKTGTLTLGKPVVKNMECHCIELSENQLLGIASAIERNSLHPLAKAIVQHAKAQNAPTFFAKNIKERIGYGIGGTIDNKDYYLSKIPTSGGMSIGLYTDNKILLVQFNFDDQIKTDTKYILQKLSKENLKLFLFTGDKRERTESLVESLGVPITVETECSPEEKKEKIIALKTKGLVTAMIGDGINDAPALAVADVGMVFSHEEQTASTDAADIVFLGGDLTLVLDTIQLATKTIQIARHCIVFGISASVIGMIAASMGYLPPIFGAILQEGIDIIVIIYALQTSRIS